MARKKKPAGPIPVDAITHDEKRTNLPTADAQEFVTPEVEQPVPLRYPRDPSLDPQLVWKGKDELDGEDLVADAPPIYIQEKIDPRVLVENLRDTAAKPEEEPELTLFEEFDGLGELDSVEFYEHAANWSNRMILGDSLNVMASLAEREALRAKVQMIYIDPPYGIKFNSNWQVSVRKRNVRDGNLADASREVEQIKAFRDTWELGIHSYLTYMRDRLEVARDLLSETGSVFVQIGDENVHLVRSLLDEIFGSDNFRSLITYRTSVGLGSEGLDGVSNYLLWYSKSSEYKFRPLYVETQPGEEGASRFTRVLLADGSARRATQAEMGDPASLPEGSHLFTDQGLTSRSGSGTTRFGYSFGGKEYVPSVGGWRTSEIGMKRLEMANRILKAGSTIRFRKHWDDFKALEVTNFWSDVSGGVSSRADPKIYVVQTATKVIERCLLLTTDPGDLVLDPTCGAGTTARVAEQWGRRWITVDTSRVALALARQRIMGARYPYYLLADSKEGREKEGELSAGPLPETEVTNDIRHGFVYDRARRITLGSIANNPDIKEGMSQDEIDDAIRRHADFEYLYDKPFEDKKKVRVAGPFTVESLSPHRSLAFAGGVYDDGARNDEAIEAPSHGDAQFELSIIDNLRAAGIQNGLKDERLEFDSIESYADPNIQAIGIRDEPEDDTPAKVGISIGPQYGTVGPSFIKDAARAANKDGGLDLLCVLAFAFDPAVIGGGGDDYVTAEEGFAEVAAERKLGKVPVLLVRMNADLVMGEELKKTGAGNLFTVFGEPDVEIEQDGDELRVRLRGVDVYDPNTGEIRSHETDQVALWMIDTNYNGESFFVRHCYFTGGQNPYKRLKTALKADIDEDAWASLYSTESRPFARPDTGRIAIKVINDYGDEVLQVFDV